MLRAVAARQVLDRPADPTRHVEIGGDARAGLADLLAVRAPAGTRHSARDTDGCSEQAGELLERREALGAADPTPAPDDDAGLRE